eukprot:scaffold27330_cov146-Isochrysis_galbana.AAC.3
MQTTAGRAATGAKRVDMARTSLCRVHDVERAGRGNRNKVLMRVEGSVQYAPRKVARQIPIALLLTLRGSSPMRRLRGFKDLVRLRIVSREQIELVLVGTSHHLRAIMIEACIELVEYAVLLI